MANILVVDDELGIRDLCRKSSTTRAQRDLAENATQARSARRRQLRPGAARHLDARHRWRLLLKRMGHGDGALTMPVIMMSGHATIDTAVEATRIGAFSFLENPSPRKNCSRPWSRAWHAAFPVQRRVHQP